MSMTTARKPTVLVVGVGEYVTGFVHGKETTSDKPLGVVALCLFSLKQRGLLGEIVLCGRSSRNFDNIRKHIQKGLQVYRDLSDESLQRFTSYPPEGHDHSDDHCYLRAMDEQCQKGDLVIVFTPDHTHYDIAHAALERGLHVLVGKPLVQKLEHHMELVRLAQENQCICAIEVHKRWDPMYQDARERIALQNNGDLGQFSYFNSYMSQPATQLVTFRQWASQSDISYYLNSHHVDFHCWALTGDDETKQENGSITHVWRPVSVYASASNGVARGEPYLLDTEDSITLVTQWHLLSLNGDKVELQKTGTAIYTASWIATAKGGVHSEQKFFFQGTEGEVSINQAHRGYTLATNNTGYRSINPLYMKYTPDTMGNFCGQNGYGYQSLESFVQVCQQINNGTLQRNDANRKLATAESVSTILTTCILRAGRLSLDTNSLVKIEYANPKLITTSPTLRCVE